MAQSSVGTGSAGQLLIIASEVGYDATANWSDISWALYLNEASEYDYSWGSTSAYVSWNPNSWGMANLWSGTFGFDWRPGGLQATLIASGTARMNHTADGTGTLYVEGGMGDSGTSGAGGPTAVGVNVPITTLKVAPGRPSSVSATRVSDSQATVSWAQSSASNGQPSTNQIYRSVNGSAFTKILDINATTSTSCAVATNQKIQFTVSAWNSAGFNAGGPSTPSAAIYTTPAAPTGVTAAKDASLNIIVSFTGNVGYTEYSHVVSHGTVSGGVTTWDASPLATLATGVFTYTHTAPNAAQVHVYRVQATAGALASAWVQSGNVQLLIAPNAPSLAVLNPYADKASALVVPWTHNSIDSTPQAFYEFGTSTNGGTTWTSSGKVTSTTMSVTIAANTYTSGAALTYRVRTWGQATTGGSDGTGASPWSAVATVTFKTAPTVAITTPGSTVGQALVLVQITFTQPEGATFVSQTMQLLQGATVLETLQSTQLAATFTTRVANGGSYSVRTTATDSNGVQSAQMSQAFTVTYLAPVPAGVTATYLLDTGFAQLDLSIPAPVTGQAAAVTLSITRSINGVTETVVASYPASAILTFLDTTPTINGTNSYVVRTVSADGASSDVPVTLVTTAGDRAFISKGNGFQNVVSFGYALKLQVVPSTDQTTVKAAGRSRPIGLYGTTGDLVVSGTATLFPGTRDGSTPEDIEAMLLTPGRCCYRDPTGRRMFGQVAGSVSRDAPRLGQLQYTVTETSS